MGPKDTPATPERNYPMTDTTTTTRGSVTVKDNRSDPRPLDGTGDTTPDPDDVVAYKCPFCDYRTDTATTAAERDVRAHITSAERGKHADRNAFSETIHVHALDADGKHIGDVYRTDADWASEDPDGEASTSILPDSVKPGSKAEAIVETALLNPDYSIPDISRALYGEMDSYVYEALKTHLSEERYAAYKRNEGVLDRVEPGGQSSESETEPDSGESSVAAGGETVAVEREQLRSFAQHIDALKQRADAECDRTDSPGAHREQYVLELVADFLTDISEGE